MDVTLPISLTPKSLDDLHARLQACGDLIVLRGEGDVFCHGLELRAWDHDGLVERFVDCIRALRCGPPTIAFIDGTARGAGVGLLAACDRVVGTPRADLALTELYFGLTPSAIWPLLCERASPARLRWAAMTGHNLDAEAAQGLGLVDEVVADFGAVARYERALRRTSREATTLLKRATAPIGAVSVGAARTRVRLKNPEVQDRIARYLEGDTPWR